MKKTSWVVIGLIAVLSFALILTGCGSSGGDKGTAQQPAAEKKVEKKVIKIGIGLNEQSPSYKGMQKFKEIVEKESKGALEVQLFANSTLGDDTKMMTALRAGTLEMSVPSSSPISGLDKRWNIFDLPFLFPNEEVIDKVVDGPVGKKFLDSLSAQGIKGLAFWENGYRQLTNSKHEIKTPADLKGLKIRTMENPVHLDAFRTMGANPTPMPFGELFTSLQQKTIDGQENPITTIYLQKFYEVQKYTTLSNHFYTPFVCMYSEKLFKALPQDQQDIIAKAAQEAALYQRKVNRDMMKECLAELEKTGNVVTKLTPEQHQAFVDATKDVAGRFETVIGKDIIQEVMDEIAKHSKK